MRAKLTFIIILWISIVSAALAADFGDEIERDFPLRTIGGLHITNMRGDVSVQGWAFDKIRVKAKRRVIAESLEEAKKILNAVDFRFRTVEGDIELSAEYGRGLDIRERLKERKSPQAEMDMVIYAPSGLKLQIWTMEGKATLKGWNASADVRTSRGAINASEVHASEVVLTCASCDIAARAIKASLRCSGGTGEVALTDVDGESVYVETNSGLIKLGRMSGAQLYVSKSGTVSGRTLRGKIEFRTGSSAVSLEDVVGFISGKTESGDISASVRDWQFEDKALLESARGNITLHLPLKFSGEVDFWSLRGKTEVGFPVARSAELQTIGPEPAMHIIGRVKDGGELLKIYTEDGNINVTRGG